MSRELLEKAAKAAGYTWRGGESFHKSVAELFYIKTSDTDWEVWLPLDDDGDAFRLAVKLDLCVGRSVDGDSWCASHNSLDQIIYESGGNPCAATRLAIVRAAAAMGEAL